MLKCHESYTRGSYQHFFLTDPPRGAKQCGTALSPSHFHLTSLRSDRQTVLSRSLQGGGPVPPGKTDPTQPELTQVGGGDQCLPAKLVCSSQPTPTPPAVPPGSTAKRRAAIKANRITWLQPKKKMPLNDYMTCVCVHTRAYMQRAHMDIHAYAYTQRSAHTHMRAHK